MNRPMALAIVMLIIFLSSQSEWKSARSAYENSATLPLNRQHRLELHKEGVKEKIIEDLMAENERLRSILDKIQQKVVAFKAISRAEHVEPTASDRTVYSTSEVSHPGLEEETMRSSRLKQGQERMGLARDGSDRASNMPELELVSDSTRNRHLRAGGGDVGELQNLRGSRKGRFATPSADDPPVLAAGT